MTRPARGCAMLMRSRAAVQGPRFAGGRILDPRLRLGERLKASRESANLTVERAAEFMGLEAHVLSGIEKGYREPSVAQAEQLSGFLVTLAAAARSIGADPKPPGASRPPIPEDERRG